MDRKRRVRSRRLQRLPQHYLRGHEGFNDGQRCSAGRPAVHGHRSCQRHDLLLRRHGGRHERQRVRPVGRGGARPLVRRPPPTAPSTSDRAPPTSASATRPSSTSARSRSRPGSAGTAPGPRSRAAATASSIIPLVAHGSPEADSSNVDENWILGINGTTGTLAADFEDMASGSQPPGLGRDGRHRQRLASRGRDLRRHHLEALSRRQPRRHPGRECRPALGHHPAGRPRHDAQLHRRHATATSTASSTKSRVWNLARTRGEIAADINAELTSGDRARRPLGPQREHRHHRRRLRRPDGHRHGHRHRHRLGVRGAADAARQRCPDRQCWR